VFSLISEEEQEQIENRLIIEHRKLFGGYFKSEEELNSFIKRNLGNSKDNIQRRTINNVQRLVSLADELTIVKPGKWDLAIFFLLSCVESIYGLNGLQMQKQEMVIDFFEKYVSADEHDFIRKSIMIAGETVPYDYQITMERFSLLLISVRNLVAHEGVYWNLQFIHEEADRIPIMHSFIAKPDKHSPVSKVLFTTTMKYSELRDIFIKGFIRFIIQHEPINALI
jgi:hypothetical protein